MPNPIISHQAPALYLKIKFPKWIDGVAICIGALVPDLTLTVEFRHVTHSLLGQIYWTVPISLVLSIIFRKYIASILSNIASKNGVIPKLLRYFGVEDWYLVKSKRIDKKFFLVALYSALIGGLSHLLLDFPSHPSIELFHPWGIFPLYEFAWISGVVWTVEDIIFFITSLYLLRKIKRDDLIKDWYLEPF
jgi:hypothetical protein